MKKNKTTSLLTAALLLATSACRERPAEKAVVPTAPVTGGTAVVALTSNIDFANGLLSGERYSQEINRSALYLTLLQHDEKLELAPRLAKRWEMQGDTAVVLHLRDDVRWHDSVKTTAYDVEFTYRYGVDANTGYPNGDYWVGWNDVQVLDTFTVRFRLTPQPEPLANLPFIPIMPKHLLGTVKAAELRNAPFNQRPVGNGPFRFVEYKPNERWVFEANRDFPKDLGGRPHLDRVVFRIIPDQTAQETELLTGNVDLITNVRAERFDSLRTRPNLQGMEKPGRQFAFVGWNTLRPPLNDVRVRRALAMGIDRNRIVTVIRRGRAEIAVGPVPPFHWSFDKSIGPLPFAPDSARALFAAAGMKDTNGDGILELPAGKEFRVELKLPSNNQTNGDMAEMIRSDLTAVGVRVITRPTDFNTMIGDVTSPQRKFDAVLMGWESDFRLVVHDMFHSRAIKNPFQFASYRNAEIDGLLDQLATTTSRTAAIPMWRRLQTIIRDEEPWTFLYYYSDLSVARDRLKGVDMDIRGSFVNLPKWSLAK